MWLQWAFAIPFAVTATVDAVLGIALVVYIKPHKEGDEK
jgi:hypothetical protein